MTSLSTTSGGGGQIQLSLNLPQKSSTESDPNEGSNYNGRKKRTFDIAFLTGQSESATEICTPSCDERESNNNNNVVIKRDSSPVCSSSEVELDRNSPYNLSHNLNQNRQNHDYSNSSDTSSMVDVDVDVELDVDVMTNGSLSEDEREVTPTQSQTTQISTPIRNHHSFLKQRSSSQSKSQTHSRVLLSLSQSHYNNHQNYRTGKIYRPGVSNSTMSPASTDISSIHTPSISTNNGSGTSSVKNKARTGHLGHLHSDLNGKKRGKSGKNAYPKNLPVKEEIRFESKRTIDINHSSDSLKIKENLQFSTLIPNNSGNTNTSNQNELLHSSHGPDPHSNPHQFLHFNGNESHQHTEFNEFILPPHLASTFALFPHIGPMTMSKFQGLLPPSALHHQLPMGQPSQHSNQSHESPSGIHFSSTKVEKSEFHNQHNHSQSSSQKLRHFSDIYSGCGYPYPNLIIHPPQFSPPNGNMSMMSSQHSPSNGGGSTLLPPSLTALSLPAQNVCAKCSIGFRMTSDLVYHMRSHHKRDTFDPLKKQREEKLKCPVCHESFRERHHLTRHMTAHQDRVDEAAAAAAAAAVSAALNGGESFGQSGGSSTKLVV